jgi:hypothetical protein
MRRAMQHNCGMGDFINQPRQPMPHLTVRALVVSIVLATIPAAANSFFGLFAGMTIASAIPYAVVPWQCPAHPTRRASRNNIVQTRGSAGTLTRIQSDFDFSVPAWVIPGTGTDFRFAAGHTAISWPGGTPDVQFFGAAAAADRNSGPGYSRREGHGRRLGAGSHRRGPGFRAGARPTALLKLIRSRPKYWTAGASLYSRFTNTSILPRDPIKADPNQPVMPTTTAVASADQNPPKM